MAELKQWDLALSKAEHAKKALDGKGTNDECGLIDYIIGLSQSGKENLDVALVHLKQAIEYNPQGEVERFLCPFLSPLV